MQRHDHIAKSGRLLFAMFNRESGIKVNLDRRAFVTEFQFHVESFIFLIV